MRYTAVLFDLDDTLIDSYHARLLALKAALHDAGISSPTAEEVLQSYDGSPFEPIINRIGSKYGVKNDLFAMYRAGLYSRPSGLITLYPGVRSLIERLYVQGTKLGVITSKFRHVETAERNAGASQDLHEVGIAELFNTVVGWEDTNNHKPHPEPVHLALANLSVAAQDSVVVGDTPADIETGRTAGCRTCLVTWGSTTHRVDDTQVDWVAETPEELLSFLTG